MRRKTDELFKQEVFSLVKDEYTFIEPYVNAYTKIKVKHNKCGNVYEVNPHDFLHGNRCPYCSINTNKTEKQFKHEVYDLVGNEYIFLDNYVNNKTKLSVKHSKCGNVYRVQPYSFLNGSRCPLCYQDNKSKTDEEFKQEIFNLVGDGYTFLDPYVNSATKIRVKHNKCGNIYEVRPNDFFKGRRCPYCAGYVKKTDEGFKQEVYDLVGDEYTFLDKYVNARTKLRVSHNKCGNVYEVQPAIFLYGIRCPYCNSPKGEVTISKILDNLNINYEAQKTFDDLIDKSYLSYDFYLPDQNILIEYQGIQHYEPIDYFGGEATFKKQQKHDKMKLDYAKNNGYTLITVPYTADSLSKIKKYLIKHGLNYKGENKWVF